MNKEIIIAVDVDDAQIFTEFSKEAHDDLIPIECRAFINVTELQEFIVNITPHLLTALTAYLVARIQNSKKEIRIKKGDIEIEIRNTDITPQTVLTLLEKLEQKTK